MCVENGQLRPTNSRLACEAHSWRNHERVDKLYFDTNAVRQPTTSMSSTSYTRKKLWFLCGEEWKHWTLERSLWNKLRDLAEQLKQTTSEEAQTESIHYGPLLVSSKKKKLSLCLLENNRSLKNKFKEVEKKMKTCQMNRRWPIIVTLPCSTEVKNKSCTEVMLDLPGDYALSGMLLKVLVHADKVDFSGWIWHTDSVSAHTHTLWHCHTWLQHWCHVVSTSSIEISITICTSANKCSLNYPTIVC